jgi:lipopolysaccharide/colanic/teichoic acid biosynthesis glycosyltransferase
VLFVQERIGRNGTPFRMYKFRTMRHDRRQAASVGYQGVERRLHHKSVHDPRHTATGRVLRRFSLDELPQLLNVMKGDMSLVGPRPEVPSVVARYEPWQHERHTVRPGLTGPWQITVRNESNGGEMCDHTDLDIEYVRNIRLRTDLRLLLATVTGLTTMRFNGA